MAAMTGLGPAARLRRAGISQRWIIPAALAALLAGGWFAALNLPGPARTAALAGLLLAMLLTLLAGFRCHRHAWPEREAQTRSAELRESEAKFRELFDSAPVAYHELDKDGVVHRVNRAECALLGYQAEEMLGRPVWDFIAGADREASREAVGRKLSGQQPLAPFQRRLLHRGGNELWVEAHDILVRNARGETTGVRTALLDITERIAAEQALRDREETLAAVFACALHAIVMIDGQGRAILWNPAAEKMFGYAAAEMLGRPIHDVLVPPALRPRFHANFPAFQRTGQGAAIGQPLELTALRKDGTEFPLEIALATVKKGLEWRTVGVIRDLSERKRAERYQYLSAEILGALNEPLGVQNVVNRILAAIQRETGCAAVGIRLRSGDDFPYFVQNGFSPDFLLSENSLIDRQDPNGGPCRDKDGAISLECTCGLVLSGRTDPASPLFTKSGSCWTNNSPQLLDIPASQDPRLHPRNICIHQGYCSVALIPIRGNHEIVGLLQLNDRKKDRFTLEEIHFFEGISASIGVALMRKQQEDALRKSEEKYRLLIENSHDIIYTLNLDGVFTFVSPSWTTLLGHPVDQVVGQPFQQFIHPDDLAECMARVRSAIETGHRQEGIEYRVRHIDGSWYWHATSAVLLKDQAGAVVGCEGAARDITGRKQAEERLREVTDRLMLAARAGAVGIWDYDVAGDRLVWDDQMLRLYGIARDQFSGAYEAWQAGVHPEDRRRADEEFQLALRGEREYDTEFRVVWTDGSVHSIRALALVQRDASGQPLRITGTNWDITSQKQAADDLLATNRQLEEATARANRMAVRAETANRAKSEFLANMSHEIRTPMNGVIGMTGLLLDTPLTPEQKGYAETVRASGESLLGIINDILDFSKIEARKLDLEIVPFDLHGALEDVLELLAVKAREKKLELLLWYAPDAPREFLGDPGRIRQVALNLVSNAIKFTESGHVLVEAGSQTVSGGVASVRIAVHDSGIGIPANRQSSLFGKFQQVDSSTTRKRGGTGLGLAISRQLVELMGGTMSLASQEGVGSSFTFAIALRTNPSLGAAQLPAVKLDGVRVLVKDDHRMNRLVIAGMCSRWGMRAEEAASGEEALRMAAAAHAGGDPYRIICVDRVPPEMDRAENPQGMEPGIILIPSAGERGEVLPMGARGPHACLVKPVREAALLDAMERVLDRPEAGAAAPLRTVHTAPLPSDPPRFANRRVLLVEDNIVNQKVGAALLGKLGCRVDVAANGREAVAMAAQLPYDLIFMDCQMPEMDGYEATGEIRRREGAAHRTPILAMTAGAMAADRERCLRAGMDAHLSKPVKAEQLRRALAKYLEARPVG
jgi:PAS domain S-box-containing protein